MLTAVKAAGILLFVMELACGSFLYLLSFLFS